MGTLLVALAACDGDRQVSGPEATMEAQVVNPGVVGDPERGEEYFNQVIDGFPPCSSCHAVKAGESIEGAPNLHNVAELAETRMENVTGPAYLYSAIRVPNGHVV